MIELPSSAFGRNLLASRNGIFEDDFLGFATAALAGWPWNVALNSGTIATTGSSAGHPGLRAFSTSSSNVGAPLINLYTSGMVFGGDEYECGWLIQTPPALSDGSETYTIFAGFGDTLTNALSVDAAYITYTHSVNSGRWTGFTSNNSNVNQMTSLSASTVQVSTWYFLQVKVNAAANRVDFFVNGTYIGYSNAQIPSGSTRALTTMFQIVKSGSGTAARVVVLDYYYHKIGIITPRF